MAAYILSNINFHDNSGTTHLYDPCMVLKLNFKHEMLKWRIKLFLRQLLIYWSHVSHFKMYGPFPRLSDHIFHVVTDAIIKIKYSCYRDKLRPDGPLGSYADFTSTLQLFYTSM